MKKVLIGIAAVIVLFFILFLAIACKEYMEVNAIDKTPVKTWDFNIDDNKHRDGTYYYFTRCPLNAFARKYGYLEILPVCCEIDYLTARAKHAVLHREYTLATGGDMCDYWIVPDQVKNPE